MEEFFVGYSYGSGGFWFYITAPSKKAILQEYPGVGVWKKPPFFDEKYLNDIKQTDSYVLGSIPELVHEVLLEAEKTAVPSKYPSDC